jgi:hypothetical protein
MESLGMPRWVDVEVINERRSFHACTVSQTHVMKFDDVSHFRRLDIVKNCGSVFLLTCPTRGRPHGFILWIETDADAMHPDAGVGLDLDFCNELREDVFVMICSSG